MGWFKNKKTLPGDDGSTYYGHTKDGNSYGTGLFNFANGDYYAGNFKNGVPNGHGTMHLSNGQEYSGEFKNDLFIG